MLQQGNVTEAQGILDAVKLTSPNGRVAIGRGRDRVKGGLYDERGELYELPAWLVTDPADIIEEQEKDDQEAGGHRKSSETAASRRDEKGKGRAADVGETIRVRARLSDRGQDLVISIGTREKVAVIVRKLQKQVDAPRIRLVYLGHVLQETKTLESQGYKAGDVVNAFVFVGPEEFVRENSKKG